MSKLPYTHAITEAELNYAAGSFLDERINDYGFMPEMHPDGKPWSKCCTADANGVCCAYRFDPELKRLNNYSRRVGRGQGTIHQHQSEYRFICGHRLDNGYLRVCAGWDATERGKDDVQS